MEIRGLLVFCIVFTTYNYSSALVSSLEVRRDGLVHCDPGNVQTATLQNLSFEWLINGTVISQIDKIAHRAFTTLNGSLLINNFESSDYGSYQCLIKQRDSILHSAPAINVGKESELNLEYCSLTRCIEANKCDFTTSKNTCPVSGDVCCSQIQDVNKYRCDHFLGACMDDCNVSLQVSAATDCIGNQKCCILV